MPLQNPPPPVVDWVNRLRPRVQTCQDELRTGLLGGGSFQTLLDQYNAKIRTIRQDFINGRGPEYAAAREVQQQANFAAEIGPVGPFDARRSDNQGRRYDAPDRMNYADIHLNEVSRFGDAGSSVSVAGDDKSVSVGLNARSLRGVGQGRSRIEVSPVVFWEFDDPSRQASDEWTRDVAPALGVT